MRHHGGVASACIHGFAPGSCLICQTLNGSKAAVATKSPKDGEAPGDRKAAKALKPAKSAKVVKAGRAEVASGPRVVPKEAARTGSPAVVKVLGLAVAVVAVIVVAWFALHLVFAVLHILELIGVALIAGYLGWAAGVHHGRKMARRG
jgi:hypothetical protein